VHAGLSPEARAAALAETGVLEADGDETTGDEEDGTSMKTTRARQPATSVTTSKAMTRVKTRGRPARRRLRARERPRAARPPAPAVSSKAVSCEGGRRRGDGGGAAGAARAVATARDVRRDR
jgi:hypothetical protein